MKLARTSIAVLLIQLAIVSSIAAKYLYQRWTCPRVWTRTQVYDPELVMRGRYLSAQLLVDACGVTVPPNDTSAASRHAFKTTVFRHGVAVDAHEVQARLAVKDGKLAIASLSDENDRQARTVSVADKDPCSDAVLEDSVDFYLPEHASAPAGSARGHELWMEVTLPPQGPPRPLQLALKENGVWKPLAFQ
jgi:uncharacterized membrane-anchored protein